jgi:hypothetical protein
MLVAKCPACDQEMQNGVSCTVLAYEGEPPRIPHKGDEPCHDCKCPPGGLHHPGCDAERCPICCGQAISCGCGRASEGD